MAAQRSAAQDAAACDLELFTDLLARGAARVALGDQRRARLKDERLDLAGGTSDRRCDLRMAQIAQLEEHERLALVVGQPPEVGHELPQLSTPPDVGGEPIDAELELVDRHRRLTAGRKHRAAAVARDREQPRPHSVRRPPRTQRAVSAHEGLLQCVLAVLTVAEHAAADRQQRGVMALVEDLERGLVARAHQRRKALVVELDKSTGPHAMPKNARHCEKDAGARRLVPAHAARPCDTAHSRPTQPGLGGVVHSPIRTAIIPSADGRVRENWPPISAIRITPASSPALVRPISLS